LAGPVLEERLFAGEEEAEGGFGEGDGPSYTA
jgi:hypothetical protein